MAVEKYTTKYHNSPTGRSFMTRPFARWADKAGLTAAALCQAVAEIADGLIDADLGGNVVKKRVPLPGRGKRGGARTLVATRHAGRWFFLYGFPKNARANIDARELDALREIAGDLLALTAVQLDAAVKAGSLLEICHDDQA